ncbi:MAG: hypothetical protein J6Z43_03450 [Clostridiales bacterium]|nr:hypothetical protein [Clostridiales bacterium]
MMINCPGCDQLIGDNNTKCPLCGYGFTEQDLKNVEDKRRFESRQQQKEDLERIRLSAKRRMQWVILLIVCMVLSFVIGFGLVALTGNISFGFVAVGLLVVTVIGLPIFGMVSGWMACPFCGGALYRSWGVCCPHCGKKYR